MPSRPVFRRWAQAAAFGLLLVFGPLGIGTPALPGRAQQNTPEAAAQAEAAPVLRVAQILPSDGAQVTADVAITVVFNRPVVALGREDAPPPFTLAPAVSGEGRWVNTAIYTFQPDALAGGTTYTLTLDRALTAADGALLAADTPLTTTFTTDRTTVLQITPPLEGPDGRIGLNTAFSVTFSQPVDQAAVEATARLDVYQEDSSSGLRPLTGTLSGAFTWSSDGRTVTFTPDTRLEYDADVVLGIPAASYGGERELAVGWRTVNRPSIAYTDPFDGQTDARPLSGFSITFTSPMNPETLRERITLSPAPAYTFDAYYTEYNTTYYLSFPTEPSTDYTVTIAPGMEDIYGTPITTETVVRFTTTPLDPSMQFQVPGSIGFYNAAEADPGFFMTTINVERVEFSRISLTVEEVMRGLLGGYADTVRMAQAAEARTERPRRWSVSPGAPRDALRYDLVSLRGGAFGNQPAPRPSPGFYLVNGSAPESEYLALSHVALVADTVLTLKSSPTGLLIWATDAQTGQPVAGAAVVVYDMMTPDAFWENPDMALTYTPPVLGTVTTDADGLAELTYSTPNDRWDRAYAAVLGGGDRFGFGYTGWSDGITPFAFGVTANFQPTAFTTYLYTDRPVYRPGQPVYVRGIARSGAAAEPRFAPITSAVELPEPAVRVVILDENGTSVNSEILDLSPEGGFSLTYTLPADLPLGYYTVRADVGDRGALMGTPPTEYGTSTAAIGFGVLEYRAPEFEITLTADGAQTADADAGTPPDTGAGPSVVQGEPASVTLAADYFFGGAVGLAAYTAEITNAPYYFQPEGYDAFTFYDSDPDAGPSETYAAFGGLVTSLSGTLDAQGRAQIAVPTVLEAGAQSQIYTVEATVLDEGGATVSGRTDLTIHAGPVYVGLAPERYVAVAGQASTVAVVALSTAGVPLAGEAVVLEAVERRWSSVQEMDAGGRTTWTYEVEEIAIASETVTTDADGLARFTFTPPNGGIFKVKARPADAEDGGSTAAVTVWASGGEYVMWRQQNSARIDLIADKRDYRPGETAEILIASPFQGESQALVTVEQGGVLRAERITLAGNSTVYRVPLTADDAPAVFVSVVVVHGVDESNPIADFRIGLVQLNVEADALALNIAVTAESSGSPAPGETITYRVTTTDADGNPVSAELGAALTDRAALTLAAPNSRDIFSLFYGDAALGVSTSSPLTLNTALTTQTILETIKGGGGGFGEGGIFDIRETFIDTAYWNARITTDASGQAEFTVTLPDNLTTWQLDVRGVATLSSGRFIVGSTTERVVSTLPVFVRPITPRFLTTGDQPVLAALVNNTTGRALTATVTLTAAGGLALDTPVQTVSVPADGTARVDWPVTVTARGGEGIALVYTVEAAADDGAVYRDSSIPPLARDDGTLPVYETVLDVVGTAGLLDSVSSITETIARPPDGTAERLTVQVETGLNDVARTGAAALAARRDITDPYTTEAVVTRIAAAQVSASLGDAYDVPGVEMALNMLIERQNIDGGWGWVEGDGSDPQTTAWALSVLAPTGSAAPGVVPGPLRPRVDLAVEQAKNYLTRQLVSPETGLSTAVLDEQAVILYALAGTEQPEASRAARLYEERARLSVYARGLLALTLLHHTRTGALAMAGEVDTLIAELATQGAMSATGIVWQEAARTPASWTTDLRTTAIVTAALAEAQPRSPLTVNAARALAARRAADGWPTLQEHIWALRALAAFAAGMGEQAGAVGYTVALNGTPLLPADAAPAEGAGRFEAESALLAADAESTLTLTRDTGSGVVYYTAFLDIMRVAAGLEPLDRGIVITREYTDEAGQPITSAPVGALITVNLTLIAPNDLFALVIEDPIPAGTAAIDPSLETSQQTGTGFGVTAEGESGDAGALPPYWAAFWFSQITYRDQAVILSARTLPAGTYTYRYTVRAGLPGTYQVRPTTAREQFSPDVSGRSAGMLFTITP
jgi:hypothetical protein